ncbi:MAG: DUF3644 domain-containing protein [Sphingomonadales bacterium]|nr:MAG: DUF3644 domain-containing protein [Sphingomonadales bacterium]TNF05507.1 MAG: DUF3644 domain-containing protein [Sphingomonadales bacterium]
MAKLVLSDREISLIKGLIVHRQFNDQQILSIFSYLDRNINHREIGSIRKNLKQRYVDTEPASEKEIDRLLYDYAKIAALADKLGFCDTDPISAQVHKAVEIMKTAIMVYNNNMIVTRSETFIVLAVIAWTHLLHARFAQSKIKPVYLNPDGTPILIDGKEKHWDLSYSLERPECNLTKGQVNNLRYIIAIRNEVEHRSNEDINDDVQAKLQATALNFLKYAKDKFGAKFDFSHDLAFTIQLQALTLQSPNMIKGEAPVAKSVAAVNALLEAPMSTADFNDPDYAYRVYVVPKVSNNSKKADQAVSFSPVGSNVEVAIKHVERPKFRMTEAIQMLLDQGIPNVTSHTFTQAWKSEDLKAPAKGLAIQLGGQWFWYQEGVDRIGEILKPAGPDE